MTSCGKNQDTIAKVGNEKISVDEFKAALMQKFHAQDASKISMEEKQSVIKDIIDEHLKVLKARELKLDEDPEYKKEVSAKEDNLIAQKLYETEIVDKLISNELLEKYAEVKGSEITANAIVLGYKGSNGNKADRTKEEAISLAEQIKSKLAQGEDPQALSQKYSDDQNLKNRNGLVKPYMAGMFDLEVDKAIAGAKPGSIVGPVTTNRGIYILKILTNKKLAHGNINGADKNRAKRELFQKYFQNQGNQDYQKLTDEFKSKMKSGLSQEGIDSFLATVKQWSSKPGFADSTFTTEQRAVKLAYIGKTEITVGDFIDQFHGRFAMFYTRYATPEGMKRILENHNNYMAWVITARDKGLENNPEVKDQINQLEQRMLTQLFDRHLAQETKVTDQDLSAYYEANKNKYMEPRKIRIWEIAVKDSKLADKIYQMASKKNSDFQKLAEKYTEKAPMKKKGGDMGYQPENSAFGEVVTKAFAIGENQIVAPFRFGPFYYVLKTGDIQPARQKTLDEVRANIEAAVKHEKQSELQKSLIDEMRNEYSFWINESLLRKLS